MKKFGAPAFSSEALRELWLLSGNGCAEVMFVIRLITWMVSSIASFLLGRAGKVQSLLVDASGLRGGRN